MVDVKGVPLIVSGGFADDMTGGGDELRSWYLDGRPGPLEVQVNRPAGVGSLVVVQLDGEPLIISGGHGGAGLCSWRLSGELGPFQVKIAHLGGVGALLAVDIEGRTLIISGGLSAGGGVDDVCSKRQIRSWEPLNVIRRLARRPDRRAAWRRRRRTC